MQRRDDWTKILGWPGFEVYRHEVDEKQKTLKLWVRRKRGTKKLICSGCGKHCGDLFDSTERAVRDLPWSGYKATVFVEMYRVRCPECRPKMEKVEQLPSKAPFSKRFEEAVGQACSGASGRQVALWFDLAESTVRSIDVRFLERWSGSRKKPPLRQMGVDEIYMGRKTKFVTVVSNLETAEPVWFGLSRKKETLDEFFRGELTGWQRSRIQVACVDMWEPFQLSIEEWAKNCAIVYDKFHILQHAGKAIDELRRAEFFRKGGELREVVKGKRWLLLTRWVNLSDGKQQMLNELFKLNRKLMKAYFMKESLDRLWTFTDEVGMLNYLRSWIDQLRWQRMPSFEKFAFTLLDHLEGILNYCRIKPPLGVVEAVNGNIKMLIRRGRGYKNLRYLLLKAQYMTAIRTEFVAFMKAA